MTDRFRSVAVAAARDAGGLLRERLDRPREVGFKGTVDLVTDADRASEALIAGRIQEAFPEHRLLGEEGARGALAEDDGSDGEGDATGGFGWLVDPLDGTTNYAHGYPHFAVSIALEQAGTLLLGVVYDPMRNELFVAERGRGATRNGEPIHVSGTEDLIRAVLTTGFSYDLARRAVQAPVWRAFLTRVQGIRQTGSAALNLCYVAAGRLDGYWEGPLQPWDTGAGALLVEEAGGRVSDLRGGSFRPYGREILASNGALHGAMLAVLAASTAKSGEALSVVPD